MLKDFRYLHSVFLLLALLIQPKLMAAPESFGLSPEVFATFDDPSVHGPYAVSSYLSGLDAPGYNSAIVYRPLGDGPFPATTLTPGYTNKKEDFSWLAEHLASHGIIVLVFTPTVSYLTDARIWAKGHVTGISTLKRENSRIDSPLFAQVDTEKLGLIGYSFGGAGAILAANELKGEIKSVVTMSAFMPVTPTSAAPQLFIVGNRDNLAQPARVAQTFRAITSPSPRAFANINGLGHFEVLNRGKKRAEISRMAIAWVKSYLALDTRYMTFINGPELDALIEEGTVFAKPSDYIFVSGN